MTWSAPDLPRSPHELTDESVERDRDLVRGQLASRLQGLWEYAERHMEEEGRPDPRFAELGLRALDRLAKVYRVDVPVQVVGEDELPEQSRERTRALVLGQLKELEARARQG